METTTTLPRSTSRHRIVDPDYGLEWIPGWRLAPLRAGTPVPGPFAVSTSVTPGCFILSAGEGEYTLMLSDERAPDRPVRLLADLAYELSPGDPARNPPLAWVLVMDERGLLVHMRGRQGPSAASGAPAERPVQLPLITRNGPAYLASRSTGDGVRLAVVTAATPEAARSAAGALLELDPLQMLVSRLQLRRRFEPTWSSHLDSRRRRALQDATEILRACLRPPAGRLRHHWIAAQPQAPARFVINDLALLSSALAEIQPRTAAEIVLSALDVQRDDGSLPAWYDPYSDTAAPHASHPVLAQAAAAVVRRERRAEFIRRLMEPLGRYLDWLDETFYDPALKLCRWPSAEEALIPETFDEAVLAPDATALYLAELIAFQSLARELGPMQYQLRFDLDRRRDELAQALETFFRTPDSGFRAVHTGKHVEVRRATASLLVPLLVSSYLFPPPSRHWVRQLLFERKLLTSRGPVAWEWWEGDDINPPLRPAIAFYILDGLCRAGLRQETESTAAALLQNGMSAGGMSGTPASSTAAVTVCALAAAEESAREMPAFQTRPPPGVREPAWLSRIAVGLLTALLAGVLLTGTVIYLRISRRPPVATLAPRLAMARYHYHFGDPRRAAAAYEELFRYRPQALTAILAGNCWFKAGDYTNALRWFETALRLNPKSVAARLNRALCLLRLGAAARAAEDYAALAELAAREGNYALYRRSYLAGWLASRLAAGEDQPSGSSAP